MELSMKHIVIPVLDCGAIQRSGDVVDRQGKIVARASTANASDIAKIAPASRSLDAILQRFADCCRSLQRPLSECVVRGITVTTFGVDGALVDAQGKLPLPGHQLKCPRTAAVMQND